MTDNLITFTLENLLDNWVKCMTGVALSFDIRILVIPVELFNLLTLTYPLPGCEIEFL